MIFNIATIKSPLLRILPRVSYVLFIISLCFSCSEKEEMKLSNYVSPGVISTELISRIPTEAKVKIRFYILDRNNNDKLTKKDISGSLELSDEDYFASFDSIKRVQTPESGNYSTAILISGGLDETVNMGDFFPSFDPFLRKFIHYSLPSNEIMIAKAGNASRKVEIVGSGFTRDKYYFDQFLAAFSRTENRPANDTLYLWEAIDSVFNYLNTKSTYNNKNLIIFISRREYFSSFISINNLITKAIQSNIKCHLINFTPDYCWSNFAVETSLKKLNIRSGGFTYTNPLYYDYRNDVGELPMYALQTATSLPNILQGNFECFEMICTLKSATNVFWGDNYYESEFSVYLGAEYGSDNSVDIPFYFYIK